MDFWVWDNERMPINRKSWQVQLYVSGMQEDAKGTAGPDTPWEKNQWVNTVFVSGYIYNDYK